MPELKPCPEIEQAKRNIMIALVDYYALLPNPKHSWNRLYYQLGGLRDALVKIGAVDEPDYTDLPF